MNILFTSVGRRSYLVQYFKEALNGQGQIHVANSSDLSSAFLMADHSVVTPLIYDKEYIPFLLDYCKENQINALISLFDIDLPILSQHKASFAKIGTNVIVSNPEFIDICNDKWKTYLFLVESGFHAPMTCLTLEETFERLDKQEIAYPVMVKPRWGMGSIAVCQADNEEELRVFYKKTKHNILKSYLKYESNTDIENSILIQEKLGGQEYGLDVINDLTGIYQNTIVKKKVAMRSGETDCAETVELPQLKAIGEKIGKLSRHVGNLDMDVFLMPDGAAYVLEMNARFGGGYPFSHLAGVNLPAAIVSWLKGEEVDPKILMPHIGVLGQKDISLVTLNKLDKMKSLKISS